MSTKISQLTSATDVTANDLVQIVDVEDGVMAPSGTNKKITASLLAKELAKQPLEHGVVISGSSSGDAVRITQTGSGNALVVEDSVNPDSSPFAINGNGQLIVGGVGLTPMSILRTLTIKTNSDYNEVNNGNIGSERYSNSSYGIAFSQGKARGTWQSPETVQSGDDLGSFVWRGHDGNQLEFAAYIGSKVDGTPEVGSMPGNLSFCTTPDGSIVSNERMRITSAGNVGIGTTSPSASCLLHLSSITSGFRPPSMTTTERNAIAAPIAGVMIYNNSTNKLNFYNGSAWEAVTSSV